jgi:hypothetical protein
MRADLLRRIEAVSTGERDKPVFGEEVRIDDCGEVRAPVASTPGALSRSAVDAGRSSDHPDSRGQKSSDPSGGKEGSKWLKCKTEYFTALMGIVMLLSMH